MIRGKKWGKGGRQWENNCFSLYFSYHLGSVSYQFIVHPTMKIALNLHWSLLLAASSLALSCDHTPILDPTASYTLETTTLGLSFPPVADDEQREFTAPLLEELSVKTVRIGEDWGLREPMKGEYNWSPLDKRMAWAAENELEIFLTIQSTGAEWACQPPMNDRSCVFGDTAAFAAYVTQLIGRYPGQVRWIQFGNEWQSEFWYAGNAADFVTAHNTLNDAVKQADSSISVVLGGFTTISLRFLAACAGNDISFSNDEGELFDQENLPELCASQEFEDALTRINHVLDHANYDMVDLHLYDDPEQWDIYLSHFQSINDAPIIVSEFGGPNLSLEPGDDMYQAERLETYIRTLDSLQVDNAFFFKLVEGTNNPAHANSGLINGSNLKKKPAFEIFKAFTR